MEWNGGMENGMERVHSYTHPFAMLLFKVVLATMCLWFLFHRRDCMSKFSVASTQISWSKLEVHVTVLLRETSYTVQVLYKLLRKVATRPRSDRESRSTDEEQYEEAEDLAIISVITFLYTKTIP